MIAEELQEYQWRRDAAWTIAAVIAAILFLLGFALTIATSPPAETPDIKPEDMPLRALLIIGFGAIACLISLVTYIVLYATRRDVDSERSLTHPSWNGWHAIRAATAIYLAVHVVGTFLGIIQVINIPMPQEFGLVFGTLFQQIGLIALPLGIVIYTGGSLASMGITTRRFFSSAFHGVFGYFATIPVYVLAFFVSALLLNLIGINPQESPGTNLLEEIDVRWLRFLFIGMIAIGAPISEEIFFRGFLMPVLRRRMTLWPAAILNGFLFSLIHANLLSIIPFIVLGAALAIIFEKTQSIVGCILFHALHNIFALVMIFYVLP